MRYLFIFLVTVIVSGCTTPDGRVTYSKPDAGAVNEISRAALVGAWFGNQPTRDGTLKQWITRRSPDGLFEARFREVRDGVVINESHELGEWGLSYELEVVITRGWLEQGGFKPAPPDAYFWDVYRIERVDEHGMIYVHHGTGHRYEVRRVADDFEFPN